VKSWLWVTRELLLYSACLSYLFLFVSLNFWAGVEVTLIYLLGLASIPGRLEIYGVEMNVCVLQFIKILWLSSFIVFIFCRVNLFSDFYVFTGGTLILVGGKFQGGCVCRPAFRANLSCIQDCDLWLRAGGVMFNSFLAFLFVVEDLLIELFLFWVYLL